MTTINQPARPNRWHIQMRRLDGTFDCYHALCDEGYARFVADWYRKRGHQVLGVVDGPWWLVEGRERCAPAGGWELMKFRKKPVVVEAMKFNGSRDSIQAICDWANRGADEPWVDYVTFDNSDRPREVLCHTLEGPLCVAEGDWVIKGTKGEFYPCKPDIFEATYEPADA